MAAYKKLYEQFYRAIFGNIKFARMRGVTIGKNCRLFTTFIGTEPFLIRIGNNVTIAPGVKLITHDGSLSLMKDERGRRYSYQPIEIGNDVFIGVNSVILPGVKIEDQVIVAAGSVVTKSVRARSVIGGVPARVLTNFDAMEKRVLEDCPSHSELTKDISYEAQVKKITRYTFKPYID
ncbi:MAG: acyltransferase [Sphingobacteriales bacterium]|nr:MAG: acyltransferase [Sphingobacteriales bacterium]